VGCPAPPSSCAVVSCESCGSVLASYLASVPAPGSTAAMQSIRGQAVGRGSMRSTRVGLWLIAVAHALAAGCWHAGPAINRSRH
jgi:hypothetical protein